LGNYFTMFLNNFSTSRNGVEHIMKQVFLKQFLLFEMTSVNVMLLLFMCALTECFLIQIPLNLYNGCSPKKCETAIECSFLITINWNYWDLLQRDQNILAVTWTDCFVQ
jgi:hypothetical protein